MFFYIKGKMKNREGSFSAPRVFRKVGYLKGCSDNVLDYSCLGR